MKCVDKSYEGINGLFLSLPDMIYKKDSPQDKRTEGQILDGTHVLSCDFEAYPFVTVDGKGAPVCRALLTCYEGSSTGYVGFFEAFENKEAVLLMLETLCKAARQKGITDLIGPIDCSIYIGYRFKTEGFEGCFTAEPYNKPYYSAMWKEAGFSVCGRYVSYMLGRVLPEHFDQRLEGLYQRCLSRGYTFSSIRKRDFLQVLEEVYRLMSRAYSGFTGYKPISREQFVSMFSYLERVLDFDMVLVARREGRLSAFCICLPNYAELTLGKMSFIKLMKLMRIRRKSKEYVILYLGADKADAGVGSALVHYVAKKMCSKGCPSIAALIKEGGLSAKYYENIHMGRHGYELLSRRL